MIAESLAERAVKHGLTPEEAYRLLLDYRVSTDELAKASFTVLKEVKGEVLLDGFVGPVDDCHARPYCLYCFRNARRFRFLSREEVVEGVKYLRGLGVKHLELGNGSVRRDDGLGIAGLIKLISRECPDVKLWFKVGYGFSLRVLRELTRLEVVEFPVVSVEVLDEGLHSMLKPGDCLSYKLNLIEKGLREGLRLGMIFIYGLGESRDSYLKLLKLLRHYGVRFLALIKYRPVKGAPYSAGLTGDEDLWVRLLACCRLLRPDLDICSAPLSRALSAGANRFVHYGLSVYPKGFGFKGGGRTRRVSNSLILHDLLNESLRYVEGAGLKASM